MKLVPNKANLHQRKVIRFRDKNKDAFALIKLNQSVYCYSPHKQSANESRKLSQRDHNTPVIIIGLKTFTGSFCDQTQFESNSAIRGTYLLARPIKALLASDINGNANPFRSLVIVNCL